MTSLMMITIAYGCPIEQSLLAIWQHHLMIAMIMDSKPAQQSLLAIRQHCPLSLAPVAHLSPDYQRIGFQCNCHKCTRYDIWVVVGVPMNVKNKRTKDWFQTDTIFMFLPNMRSESLYKYQSEDPTWGVGVWVGWVASVSAPDSLISAIATVSGS